MFVKPCLLSSVFSDFPFGDFPLCRNPAQISVMLPEQALLSNAEEEAKSQASRAVGISKASALVLITLVGVNSLKGFTDSHEALSLILYPCCGSVIRIHTCLSTPPLSQFCLLVEDRVLRTEGIEATF